MYRCTRQALKQCWEGGEEGGSGEMLTVKVQGFVWLLTACPDIRPEMCQSVSWSLNPSGNGVCRDSIPGPPCPDSPSHPPPTLSQLPVLLCTTMHSKSSTTLPCTSGTFLCPRRSLCLEGVTLPREWEEVGEEEGRRKNYSSKMVVWTSTVQVKSVPGSQLRCSV